MTKTKKHEAAGDGPFFFISRRRWLKLSLGGLGGAVGLLGGATGTMLAMRGSAAAVEGLKVLSAQHYRTLTALAHAMIPRGGAFPFGAADLDLARLFDGFLADEPQKNIDELSMALTLIEFGPVIFEGRARTFSKLPELEQVAHFQRWGQSDLLIRRKVAIAFRKFLFLVFYDQPQCWKPIGYGGPKS